MLFYESHNETFNMFSSSATAGSDPNSSSALGGQQNISYEDESSPMSSYRKQAFASEGDEIFLPYNADSNLPRFRPFESNPFSSVPSAPLENPFATAAASVVNSYPSQQGGDGKPSSHGSDGSSYISGRPFGNDTRHSSPSISVDSVSVHTNHSSQLNNVHSLSFHSHIPKQQQQQPQQQYQQQPQQQQSQQSFLNVQTLPFIPDIKKVPAASSSPRKENIAATHILQSQNINSVKLRFSTHVSKADILKGENGYWDIRMQLVMFVSSTRNGTVESKATHMVQKWYTDFCNFHDLLGLSQFGILFPTLNFDSQQQGGPISTDDLQSLQKYLVTMTESFLNVDHRNRMAQKILTFLEDDANSLSDKMRMLLLEARLVSTMNCCDQLQSRLQITEKNLSESLNLVAFLRYRVEQLESSGKTSTGDPMRQPQAIGRYGGPSSQSSTGNLSNSVDPARLVQNVSLGDMSADGANPSQLVNLAESVLNEKGPLPVGEVGKMLQEATGNPNLSQILKEKHNGLKKFLEKYSDKFIMSCDHPFNPHVYLRRSYSPDDQRLIESGSTVFLDKKIKRTRRKEKKTWPSTGVPSPTHGSFQTKNYI